MTGIPQRYLTGRHPGVGGVIKQELEDFIVHEVPLYSPADHGEHTYFQLEKSDVSTLDAVDRIARALGVSPGEIGFAGLKDRKAITRQVLSVRRVPPEHVLALRISQLRVLWARRHLNKLRVGHLRGNRFFIRLRGVGSSMAARRRLQAIVASVTELGVPNYYGPQRFGNRGDSFRVGLALLRHDHSTAVRRILGFPSTTERNPRVLIARHRFMNDDLQGALDVLPNNYRTERDLLRYLVRSNNNCRGGTKRLPRNVKKIYYSSLQSYLFNNVLDRRLELTGDVPGRLFEGDLAFLHRNGSVFQVRNPEREQLRANAFEISPSGPIYGKLMPNPMGLQHQIECDILDRMDLKHSGFHQLMPGLHMRGGRRALRIPVKELSWEQNGSDVRFQFFLPKGSYATTFLREVMKTDTPPIAFYSDCAEDVPIPESLEESRGVESDVRSPELSV